MLAKAVHAGAGYNRCCTWSLRFSTAATSLPLPLSRCFSAQPRRHFSLSDLASASEASSPLVLRSASTNPYHNLAIEDYLLRESAHSSHILFLYTNRPCIVLGRNQNPWLECNLGSIQDGLRPAAEAESQDKDKRIPIDLVRRRSGGGTVFHDQGNLNYSVIVPNDTTFKRATHVKMVVDALNEMTEYDFKAQIKVSERNDIVMLPDGQRDWLKISGSAFKLIRGRALHHGTLLYSSAYLNCISDLLRSPGRALIHAKGVESVRSKVGNLLWTADLQQRLALRESISQAIVQQFRARYGQGSDEVVEVGDHDVELVAAHNTPSIRHGANEMATNEWRFGQTPKFDFQSEFVQWQGQKSQIVFQSNRGQLDQLSWLDGKGRQTIVQDVTGTSLHTIDDWSSTLERLLCKEGNTDDINAPWHNRALVQLMEATFPPWPVTADS